MSIAATDPIAAFLAAKQLPGVPADVYAAELRAVTAHVPCPQLAYRQTLNQLTPDPREAAVEAVLTAAGDYDDIALAITVVSALRPDLDRGDVLDGIHRLYELSDEIGRANTRGDRTVEEHLSDRYENVLADLAHGPVTR